MTIRLINVPSASESFFRVLSNVKEVTKFNVIFHDGSSTPKRLCSKVEIVSLMDAPEDYYEAEEFYINNGCSKYCEIRERVISYTSGYKKMNSAQFNELDLPTFL